MRSRTDCRGHVVPSIIRLTVLGSTPALRATAAALVCRSEIRAATAAPALLRSSPVILQQTIEAEKGGAPPPMRCMIGRMGRLPNMPSRGTPRRAIRIPDELWYAALAKAERSGEPLNEVIRRALERYVTGEDQEQEPD